MFPFFFPFTRNVNLWLLYFLPDTFTFLLTDGTLLCSGVTLEPGTPAGILLCSGNGATVEITAGLKLGSSDGVATGGAGVLLCSGNRLGSISSSAVS